MLGRGSRGEVDRPPVATAETSRTAADAEAAVWERVQLARNLKRPHTLELLEAMADDFIELHGDRLFGDDAAIVGGLATIGGRRVVVLGQQKGAETEENIRRNFGMPHPEGYRKAMRLMELGERFRPARRDLRRRPRRPPRPRIRGARHRRGDRPLGRPDDPPADPDRGGHHRRGRLGRRPRHRRRRRRHRPRERRLLVISPEGCASILWRTPDRAATAALAMRMTAADQLELGVVDVVVPEPGEGAQADHAETARRLKAAIVGQLDALAAIPLDELVESRYRRYRALGAYTVVEREAPPAPAERPAWPTASRAARDEPAGRAGGTSGRPPADPPALEEV